MGGFHFSANLRIIAKLTFREKIRRVIMEKSATCPLKKTWVENFSEHGFYPGAHSLPQIESSFSSMKDILDMNTASMAIETYSAYQTVKYFLNSKGSTAVKHFRRPDVKHTPVSSSLVKNLQASRQ